MTLEERFWQKAALQENGCLLWTGAYFRESKARGDIRAGKISYGRVGRNYKFYLAHRVAWEYAKGPIPERLQVLHDCGNKLCINPEHLYLGNDLDNQKDTKRLGENAVVQPKKRYLNDWQRRVCRHLYRRITAPVLASFFGVPTNGIYSTARGGFSLAKNF